MNGIRALSQRLRRWQFRRRLAAPRLVAAFARACPEAVFVEVGANDGMQHDHLRQAILESRWTGVMVEPVPYVFARLGDNYAGLVRVTLENAAIGPSDGVLPFHHLREAGPTECGSLPSWYDGIGSFSREQVLGHAADIPDIQARLAVSDVPCLTWESLLRKHRLTRVDLVLVDVEGHDAEVVRQVIRTPGSRPTLLAYEHFHLSAAERGATRAEVLAAGYSVLEEGFDTWCLRLDDAHPRVAALWRHLRPGIPALSARAADADDATIISAADRLYLESFYDDSVPLPAGAQETLTEGNPRLAQLRAAYSDLRIPATAGSRWRSAAVKNFLDLRYFRGETLFTWHYRDLPRVTQLKYFVLLQYVAARDPEGLVARLGEDGGFGCWTFEYPGRGRVSRDLLQSVNEICFLERQLGLRRREAFTVLDVGAGYGRLAHRMAQAYPNLTDYCCIDAVPEATFLSGYYLAHRGVTPPARVVALHEHAQLRPDRFEIAVNIHSFSECPLEAIAWWLGRLKELRVKHLLLVPNDADRFLSLETDGTRRDFAPLVSAAGFELVHREPTYDDPAVRALLKVEDQFHLFEQRA